MSPTFGIQFGSQGDPMQDKLYEASALHNVAVGKWWLGSSSHVGTHALHMHPPQTSLVVSRWARFSFPSFWRCIHKVQRVPFQGHSDAVRRSDSTKKTLGFLHKIKHPISNFQWFRNIYHARHKKSAITQPISTSSPHLGLGPTPSLAFSVGWSKGGQRSPANLPTAGFKEVPGPGLGSSGKDDHEWLQNTKHHLFPIFYRYFFAQLCENTHTHTPDPGMTWKTHRGCTTSLHCGLAPTPRWAGEKGSCHTWHGTMRLKWTRQALESRAFHLLRPIFFVFFNNKGSKKSYIKEALINARSLTWRKFC